METKLVPTTNANGGLLRIDGICNDITARIELETALAAEIKEKQREITAAVITAQENERYFLGEELHDNINPILSTARLYIDCVLSGDERQQHLLSESKDFIGTAINEIRTLSKSLIPPSLGDIGLVEAMEDMVNNIRAVNKLVFITDFDTIDDNLLSRNLKLTIFRIVQEQLNNIMKHANAKTVWVRLNYNAGKLRLTVKDDGIGFDTKLKRNGVGLQNITSRTELCNGNVSVTASPGMGCELTASFTLDTSQNCIEIGLRA
jgi:signal transduction histidine kinase